MVSILSKRSPRYFHFLYKLATNLVDFSTSRSLSVLAFRSDLLPRISLVNNLRGISFTTINRSEDDEDEGTRKRKRKIPTDPSKDRRNPIPVEVSLRYMNSKAYNTTYGDDPVFKKYRRNFKGQFQPKRTRRKCIKLGYIATGNPCPICRDEYLVLHYTNVKLLKQFISPQTGKVYEATFSGLCREKQFQLEVEVAKARDYGYLTYQVPFREYNYKEFYKNLPKSDAFS